MSRIRPLKKAWLYIIGAIALLIFIGQQCSNVNLEFYEETSFLSLGRSPFRLDPPFDFPAVRRLVFFVDMSQSMVSGPCVQDVDANINFSTTPLYQIFDPNKGTGNPNDHRGSGIDCQVNPDLPITHSSILNDQPDLSVPTFFQTTLGNDHEADRLKILRTWITNSLTNNPQRLIDDTKIMIIPVSGGISQEKLLAEWSARTGKPSVYEFLPLTDDIHFETLDWMEEVHTFNLSLSESDDLWRYKDRSMGTSSPGPLLPELFDKIEEDMRELNDDGLLSLADYQIITMTDGLLTPVQKNIEDTLNFFGTCSTCAAYPQNCSGTCGTLVQKLINAWGSPNYNDLPKLDFYYGLMQALPAYFGAGYVKLDFVQLKKSRMEALNPDKVNRSFMDELKPYFEARSTKLSLWQSTNDQPPFRLVGESNVSGAYKVTHLFVLSPNVRVNKQDVLSVDSDGDGLFDNEEAAAGASAVLPRTNNYCLDSFMANPAFAERCQAMSSSRSCDPTLDSDLDELNECEESLLGTDTFDFDTDGDGIPDYFEWLYGYNPLISDEGIDNNGDGFLNMTNFASNLSPQHLINVLPADYSSKYAVNFKGNETLRSADFGEVSVELYELIVHHVPVAGGYGVSTSSQIPRTYSSRVSVIATNSNPNLIPYSQRLISVNKDPYHNGLVALARMIDISNPERAYWRLYKMDVPITDVYTQPRMDLSLFEMIRTRDRNE